MCDPAAAAAEAPERHAPKVISNKKTLFLNLFKIFLAYFARLPNFAALQNN